MDCYIIVEKIPYEGDEILGIDFTYDGAKALFDKACQDSIYTHIAMIELPVGKLLVYYNQKIVEERIAAEYPRQR